MAANRPKKQLSLDTNVLLDLAKPLDSAHDFREQFQQRRYTLLLAPTVVAELEYLASYGTEPHRSLAQRAAEQISAWHLTPFDLPALPLDLAEQFARRLLEQRLIPDDEFNDGLILAETSLAEIPLLVTSDKHLLDIDEDALALAFSEADLVAVHPVHPKRLLRALQ